MSDPKGPSELSDEAKKAKSAPVRFFLGADLLADKEKLTKFFEEVLKKAK